MRDDGLDGFVSSAPQRRGIAGAAAGGWGLRLCMRRRRPGQSSGRQCSPTHTGESGRRRRSSTACTCHSCGWVCALVIPLPEGFSGGGHRPPVCSSQGGGGRSTTRQPMAAINRVLAINKADCMCRNQQPPCPLSPITSRLFSLLAFPPAFQSSSSPCPRVCCDPQPYHGA